MNFKAMIKTSLFNAGLAAALLLATEGAALAQSAVTLTAAPTTANLPDGQIVPMWGYFCGTGTDAASGTGVSCTAMNGTAQSGTAWQPPLIRVPAGASLTIKLKNQLNFGTGDQAIPTSIVIDGQLGGGLGNPPTRMPSPSHAPQGTTWPGIAGDATPSSCSDGTFGDTGTFCPPAQADRVRSFATEVPAGGTSGLNSIPALTWTNLRAGTYLIHTGTQPSIQHPMGLYGVLVVTEDPAKCSATPQCAYPSSPTNAASGTAYDADVPLLFSEIDPEQNNAVAAAVTTAGFNATATWAGPGACKGGVAACYPPAVNYSPRYYLINGTSFDRTNVDASTLKVPASPTAAGNVLLRIVNAGQRMHAPSVVGANMTLLAEDGNMVPGGTRVQSSIPMPPGKSFDATIRPIQGSGTYAAGTYPVYDRQLSLSTNNQRDGGMQAYIAVAGGAATGSAGSSSSAVTLSAATNLTFYCVAGNPLTVTDVSKGLLRGVIGASGVALPASPAFTLDVNATTLSLNADGTFSYTPSTSATASTPPTCGGTFQFLVNGQSPAFTATIQQCDSNAGNNVNSCTLAAAPTAKDFVVVSNVASRYTSPPPGVLAYVTNSSGLALSAVAAGTVNKDGSFVATGPGTSGACPTGALASQVPAGAKCTAVPYRVKDAQGQTSNATAYVAFRPGSGLNVTVKDGPTGKLLAQDYRWIIEEDRTFWIDPKCQINSTGTRLDSRGNACPALPVESLGYNFHTANMPVIAAGCVGTVSCEAGQKVQGADAVCDVGNGACRAGASKTPTSPADVYLDPSKRYFISILPGDAINPTISGFGGTVKDCGKYDPSDPNWVLYDPSSGGSGNCGHEMGGVQLPPGATTATINLQQIPLQTAKISVFVFQDDNPLNGENDAGGGVDVIAPNEPGLGGFEIKLFDQAGQLGDNTGQITYDEFNQPISNALAGYIDPLTGLDACPISARVTNNVVANAIKSGVLTSGTQGTKVCTPDSPCTCTAAKACTGDGSQVGTLGMVPTCPKYESDGKTPSPLAGQVVIANLYPGLYEIQAYPAADRIARGEQWLQTNTLDGGKPHEAFIKPSEPGYFQEFGPGGFHVAIGFANPTIINARKNGYCNSTLNTNAQGQSLGCNNTLTVEVTNNHMSRTPDQRTFDSESYDHYSFTQCYVSIGPADAEDFAFQNCVLTTDAAGKTHATATFTGMPPGTFKLTVFDQWNDIMLDGLVGSVSVAGGGTTTKKIFPVTQWRTNLFTRTYIDDGSGVSSDDKPGLALVNTNIRYRDGSIAFFNNTDMNGYAGFNEVFPFMNWLVVETTATRFKPTWTHSVYDAGGPVDCSSQAKDFDGNPLCSTIAANLANTNVRLPLPADLRVPGAKYCDDADCLSGTFGGKSTGALFPAQPFGNTMGWQGLLGQNTFMEFGVTPFKKATGSTPAENGGIHGQVVYASTRPFDDPSLLLQLSWEPGIPHATINLYRKDVDSNGNETLKLVDTTQSASWDDWAQGFRKDANGNLIQKPDGTYIPNMNCPGQGNDSPFFATLKNSKQWLDADKKSLAYNSQFKCYDGWSQLNQAQPAPYDGYYSFPSVLAIDPANGKPSKTNCTTCVDNPSGDGTKMLPAGTYVVEVIPPTGYELVKEEDKNILMGDVYVAPVSQQFAGFGNVFIMPDQAQVNSLYNASSPGGLNPTVALGSKTFPRHEGDTGSVEAFWPCVGALRQVPDFNSEFPGAQQAAPFAGAMRRLCDRKEVKLTDEASVLAKFFLFSSTHIAGHFTGTITNDFASEFDPFSPQFGEKFGPPNLPVALRDFNGNEVARVYSDQWGIYNGLYFSTWSPNPPNPTGYAPQMSIACMNDPGPINIGTSTTPNWVTDPSYNPAYSNFCYEQPFMPGTTTYMDTPVIPTQAFADGYNLPDTEYPDGTPAIRKVNGDGVGPYVAAAGSGNVVSSVTLILGGTGYTSAPAVTFSGGGGSGASATTTLSPSAVGAVTVGTRGSGYTSVPGVTFGGTGSGAAATAVMRVGSTTVTSANGSYTGIATPTVTFSTPSCWTGANTTTCIRATGTATMSNTNRRVTGINIGNVGLGYTLPPTITFSTGPATATAALSVDRINLTSGGTGYVAPIAVGFTDGGGTGATATATVAPTSVASITLTTGGSSYASAPTVTIAAPPSGIRATATDTIAQTGKITITALGDKVVQNPNFAGPNATTAPYNQKTITRHYDFGTTVGTVALVDSTGVPHALTGVTWNPTTITGTVPTLTAAQSTCAIAQRTTPTSIGTSARCGELVITRGDNGKKSIDAITVTVGGSAPWIVTPNDFLTNTGGSVTAPAGKSVQDYSTNFGRMFFSPLQVAIDSADPGDLILVQPGTYRENLIMWKPVRLQGVGAAAVTINADAHPAGKMDQWRRQMNCVFGLTLDGVPNLGNTAFQGADPNNSSYSCPDTMHQRVDRIPFEAIIGWDASGNGNLAQVLQEPTLMGAYEGAGITVLGRGVRAPSCSDPTFGTNCQDFWGKNATGGAGAFTDGSVYLGSNTADCTTNSSANGLDYGTSNFFCNPSRIDGVSVLNSSQGGGGVFIHGWAHNLEVANTRISGNHGTLAGAINLGNGETPDGFINDGVECGNGSTGAMTCPPLTWNGYTTPANGTIPMQFNTKVRIHHNMLYNNASIGDALFSGTPAGAGAITVSSGADGYQIDHNWIAGNLSTGDGGGLQHLGLSFQGKIDHNYVLFNQSTNPTLPTNGGGIVIEGANLDRQLNGVECGSTNDQDCPPGLGEGTGAGLVIDANLILGNSAESGSGGGLRIQQVNGSDLVAFPTTNSRWYDVTVTNNIISNNVAGWDGGGVSLQDALKVTFVNNTVASNDTTASAGSLFKTLGAINAASPPPGCNPTTDPSLPQDPSCTGANAPHGPQPAGLVVMYHTPNLIAQMPGNTSCPSGFGYGTSGSSNNDCRKLSKPKLVNNLFWQNRAFSVTIIGSGSGNQSQQNLIALTPVLNQTSTGACPSGANFWDIGLRTDDVASGVLSTANKLAVTNSIYTFDVQGVIATCTGSCNNTVGGTTSPVIAQYCNGARVPPENCASQSGQVSQASCKGYNTPVGASETTSLTQQFALNGIQPTATVDEGHNWLNLVYGPLTLGRPNLSSPNSTNAEMMVASAAYGTAEGAYSIPAGSLAVGRGITSGLPATSSNDFFGNPRTLSGSGARADAGAVQLTSESFASVRPTDVEFGNVRLTLTSDQTLTLTTGNTAVAIPANPVTGTGFTRPTGAAGGTCASGANQAANTTCTIIVRFAPTTQGTASGSVAIGTVVGSPVTLHGTGVQVALSVTSASGALLQFSDTFVGTTNATTQLVTLTNTTAPGAPVTGIKFAFTGPFARSTTTAGSCQALTVANPTFDLASGATCTIGVVFQPTALNPATGLITVSATGFNVDGSPLQLTGNGLLPAVTPAALDFGNVPVGTVVTQTLTINNGNNSLSNSLAFPNIAVTGLPGSGFSRPTGTAGGTCGTSLGAGATCTIVVQFSQTAGTTPTGAMSGTVTIKGNPGGVTTLVPVVQLTANSVAATHTASISPAAIDFGHVTVTQNATQDLTVTNTGNSALGGMTITGIAAPFTRITTGLPATAPNCGTTLAIGASCTVRVRFTPTAVTTSNATLTVSGTGATAPVPAVSSTLTGIGDAPPVPATPTGGSANRGGAGNPITANLNWTDTLYASSYDVQWSTSLTNINADTGTVITNANTASSYTFNGGPSGIASGTTVYFKVRAVNITGTSGWSTVFSSTVR